MSKILYEAQQYFPRKCVQCPFLIGLIEDGEISLGEVNQSEVIAVLREEAEEHNFEHCPGPLVVLNPNSENATCMSFPD